LWSEASARWQRRESLLRRSDLDGPLALPSLRDFRFRLFLVARLLRQWLRRGCWTGFFARAAGTSLVFIVVGGGLVFVLPSLFRQVNLAHDEFVQLQPLSALVRPAID
jgi:hypothetical protein